MMNGATTVGETTRRDIDGLRAIAVLIVLLFHAKLGDWPGGFVGVDVFFVISGYLIVPQIAAGLESGRFHLIEFFARRIRRLVPALVPVLAFCFAAAFFLYGASGMAQFSSSLLGAAAFVSNYVFLAQSGYFQEAADEILLLHTWSLGIEFQFYAIMPLICLAAHRRISMVTVLSVLGLMSFALSVALVQTGHADDAFYGILPRFWELAVGGIVGLTRLPLPRTARVGFGMRLAGLVAIGLAATQFDSGMPFPGVAALLPVAGAVLILTAPSKAGDPILWALSSKGMNWIGLRSYSIYLWHWPLIVLVGQLMTPKDKTYIAALITSLVLADLSYRFVETPVRKLPAWRTNARLATLAIIPIASVATAWAVVRTDAFSDFRMLLPGASQRYVRDLSQGAREEYMETVHTSKVDGKRITRGIQCSLDEPTPADITVECLKRSGYRRPVLVIGDSHGRDTFHALRIGFPKTDFVLLNHSGCAPAEYIPYGTKVCFPDLFPMLEALLAKMPADAVVLSAQWAENGIAKMGATLEFLSRKGVRTIVVGPTPTFRLSAPALLVQSGVTRADADTRLKPADYLFDIERSDRLLHAQAAAANLPYIEALGSFCDISGCLAFVPGKDGALMFWDNQHLTVDGMFWLGDVFAKNRAFRQILGTDPQLSIRDQNLQQGD